MLDRVRAHTSLPLAVGFGISNREHVEDVGRRAEAAVVGRPDDLTGTAMVAFVTPKRGTQVDGELQRTLRNHVARQIGAIAKPAEIRFTDALPKTRSGKIMRRLLRDIASGRETLGDTTTLEDYSVLAKLRESEEA